MQRFVAELTATIDRADFERCWQETPCGSDKQRKVEFVFTGNRVSASVHSGAADPWPSASFHAIFSATVRRIDRSCNVRWL